MGANERSDALGGLLLGLAMLALVASDGSPTAAPLAIPPRPSDPVTAASLGWPVQSSCGRPDVWRALPSVGPARAERLASAADRGVLGSQSDLLQVPGIGIKMAALLAPRLSWTTEAPGACQPAEEP